MEQPPSKHAKVEKESLSTSEEEKQGIQDSKQNTEADFSPILSDVGGFEAEPCYQPEKQEVLPEVKHKVLEETPKAESYSKSLFSSQGEKLPMLSDEDRGRISQNSLKDFLINNNVYECKNCNILYKDALVFRTHMRMHVKGATPFQCKCGKSCDDSHNFHSHLHGGLHDIESYQEYEEPLPLPWNLPYSMDDHRKLDWWNIRKKNGLYLCADCLILYQDGGLQVLHDLYHDRIKESAFKCRYCKIIFTNRVEFNRHLIEAQHIIKLTSKAFQKWDI